MFDRVLVGSALGLTAGFATAQDFVNWETPHVHPLELAVGSNELFAVNTPDNRLEVFDVSTGIPAHAWSTAVGLDPVSVRARNGAEVWVVNHVSDSVSVVDLATRRVRATLTTDDEPADVIFAGTPERAFVTCSQANTLQVFDPNDLSIAPITIPLSGEDPRALAVSPDGSTVYAAIFESGNATTVLAGGGTLTGGTPPNVVNDPAGPWGGVNPPPNDGPGFTPAQKPGNPPPPAVGLIVRRDANGSWFDDNGGDWTALVSGPQAALSGRVVGWDLLDHDVAIVDASTLSVSYATGLMNVCMALGVHPVSGELFVVGTEATNEVRYEPNLNGTFVRSMLARVDPSGPATNALVDLNPHLSYAGPTVAQNLRDRSLGDPRSLAWNGAGTRAYVTGLGSNNVVVLDASGARAGLQPTIEVGEGPTGAVVDDVHARLYVLNKFEASVSAIDLASETEVARAPFFDPTPVAIRVGRKHLYDTHETSGLGQVACAACHVDARMDRLAWDLGDPGGDVLPFAGNCPDNGCQDWHPMKGPMTTQTLQDIIGHEPHHWRGDRTGIEEFAGAFMGLLGDDETLTPTEMQEFEDFLATIHFPPNPYRNLDNTLPQNLPLPGHFSAGRFSPAGTAMPNGDAVSGLNLYRTALLDGVQCVTCHTLPTGAGTDYALQGFQLVPIPPGPDGERHHTLVSVDETTNVTIKVPHLRNQHEKVGFELTQTGNVAGFGFLHDGSIDSITRFLSEPLFSVGSDQDLADLVAFMLAFAGSDLPAGSTTNPLEPPGTTSLDTHAAVGTQVTLVDAQNPAAGQTALLASVRALADAGAVGLVVKGVFAGEQRGWHYISPGSYQSDRAAETVGAATLEAAPVPGAELTWTVVPAGSEVRIGVDRDRDGFFDRDELDAGSDPADPASIPCGSPVPADPLNLVALGLSRTKIDLSWIDASGDEDGFSVERRVQGVGPFTEIVALPADTTGWVDSGLACGTTYEYRVRAFNCGGASGAITATERTAKCPTKRWTQLTK